MQQSSSNLRPLRIVFAGTPEFAAKHLYALLGSQHQVVGVYTQPDRPTGRGKKPKPSAVKALAEAHQLPVFQPVTLKTSSEQLVLANLQPDLMIVVAYGLILPPPVLAIPVLGCINVHASLLPRWRGAAPIQRALEAGDRKTGITIMEMEEGLDTGPMLARAECSITECETGGSLHDKLLSMGSQLLLETIERLARGAVVSTPQDHAHANYAPKLSKAEGAIDWALSAAEIDRKVRAFNPFPVAYCTIESGQKGVVRHERLRIWAGAPTEQAVGEQAPSLAESSPAGLILSAEEHGILVVCGEGIYCIKELQLPGRKRLAVSEILKSRADLFTPGKVLLSGD